MNSNKIQKNKKVYIITFLGFIFSFSVMLIMFSSSFYFKEIIGSDNISVFYVIISIFAFFSLLNLHIFFHKLGKSKTLFILLFIQIILLAILTYFSISIIASLILMLYIGIYNILMVVWDAILEEYSENEDTGRVRGLFLSFWNFGGMIAPAFGAILMERYGFFSIFLISLVIYIIMFIVSFLSLNNIKIRKKTNESILELFKRMKSNKDIWNIFCISLILRFFYAIGTIFFPLYLVSIGLSISQVGIIFTATFIPYVLFEYKLGILADKKYGEKEMLIAGFVIMIVFMIFIYFSKSNSFIYWLFLLFFSYVGATLVEVMSDTYFYKKIDSDDIVMSNFFRSSRPLAYLVGAVIGGIIQMCFGFKAVFLLTIITVVLGIYPAIILRDTNPTEK